jgi:hypothetical protein
MPPSYWDKGDKMRTITLYHDPVQKLLHKITCEVNPTTGEHSVVESKILSSLVMHVPAVAWAIGSIIGHDKVRAYTITPVEV